MTDNCKGPLIIGTFHLALVPIGKGMSEVATLKGSSLSPSDSNCNSNHHGSASFLSTSSQDIDFIQDNSDYQWFIDYGYRDGGTNHHTSILSLPESYETGDFNYYDALAKNMDANLAEADMESFRTEDIHALLTNLPPMCMDHISQENNRQGECYASVSGSLMARFDFDSSISPHSSSQGEDSTSMSICKSELLFSPVKETPMPGVNFSVDSLDCDFQDMMLTCQANKDNYTIAFEGSITMYSEESDFPGTDKSDNSGSGSTHWMSDLKTQSDKLKKLSTAPMTQSDSGNLTTWSKLRKCSGDNYLRRHPSGNNNNSGDETTHIGLTDNALKSRSMPNLHKKKLKNAITNNLIQSQNSSSDACTVKRRPVKVFNIQHHVQSCSGSGDSVSDMATSVDTSNSDTNANKQPNFSLVKLFMKQKSLSTEGMSTTMDQLSSTENWPTNQSADSNYFESKCIEQLKHLETSFDGKTNESSIKTYDLIAEEPEEDCVRKQSNEELSESISKFGSDGNSSTEKKIHNINNNNSLRDSNKFKIESPIKRSNIKSTRNNSINRSIQTSHFSELINLKNSQRSNQTRQDTYKIIEPSFLSKLRHEGEIPKPVYVLYPNYVLPNLDFLNEKEKDMTKVLLMPQKAPSVSTSSKKRPFSCNDLEMLKKKGFSHVKDWESLNFLLPQECKQILAEVPEISEYMKRNPHEKLVMPSNKSRRRPMSCDYTGIIERTNSNQTNISSSSSTATQPSSGYRGSSTILNDSHNSPVPVSNNPLFVYRYDSVTSSEASLMVNERPRPIVTTAPPLPKRNNFSHIDVVPPRPPLPKSILNKCELIKRHSMYDTSDEDVTDDNRHKRISLVEPYYLARNKRLSETEDEGVDAGTSSSSLDEHESKRSFPKTDHLFPNMSVDELLQFEEFLKVSGISTSDHEEMNEESITQLRSYVSKFLSLKMNQDGGEHFGGKKMVSFAEKINLLPKHLEMKPFLAPNNSPDVSAFLHHKNYQNNSGIDGSPQKAHDVSYSSPRITTMHKLPLHMVQKCSLINAVSAAVEQIMHLFSTATNEAELNALGDSTLNPACAKIALTSLCPALYAVLSDGLKPNLESSFGAINNSVWQVVEASAKQGPLTKALNELVMRINSEDAITEGLVKFNTFVFGLLNVRSLDAWASYLRTRESVLRKHYNNDSLLVLSHTGGADVRTLLDKLIGALQPLASLPFQLDLFYEYKQLHISLKRMDSYQQSLSPTQKHLFSPSLKQWGSPGLSAHSNRSNSESEETSAATAIHNYTMPHEETLPDLLNSSANFRINYRNEKERPRSCCDPSALSKPSFKLGEDVTSIAKKRWSGISLNSKLYQAYDRLSKEEEYTDSLENPANFVEDLEDGDGTCGVQRRSPESLDSNLADDKPLNGKRFKKLQQKWEMLSGKDSFDSPPDSPTHTPNKSRIPRLITSPVKPSGIPVPISPTAKPSGKTVKKVTTPPGVKFGGLSKINSVKNSPVKKATAANTRTSRVDQLENETPKHPPRPSSLPYKTVTSNGSKSSKITPPRRAASNSLNRRPLSIHAKTPKVVRTLTHRLPSESGHLSYNEGENLKVILKVDDKWLLCCRGTQKGLVPISAVMSADAGRF